ncbi:MAG: hypothetical protein Q4D27_00555 [Coriobacteriia bacterium]|nr:hypothetical protein [Coriobacteriia bacterium]
MDNQDYRYEDQPRRRSSQQGDARRTSDQAYDRARYERRPSSASQRGTGYDAPRTSGYARQGSASRQTPSRQSYSGASGSHRRGGYESRNVSRERYDARDYERAEYYDEDYDRGYAPSQRQSGRRVSADAPERRQSGARPRSAVPRNAYAGGRQVRAQQQGGAAALLQNVWLQRGILVAGVLIALFILMNIVSCIGGAIAPQQDANSEVAAVESSEATESSSSSSASEGSSSSSSAGAQEGVVSPWTESGYFSTGDSTLDNYVKDFCDKNSNSSDTFSANAEAVNRIVSTQADYVERENNQSPWGPDWDVEYAKQFFEAGNSGNCYNSAAVTQFILQYFGYSDAEGQPCIVELQSGDWGDHGLVFVTNKVDGKRCIVDDALGGNGWMLDIDSYSFDVRNIDQNPTVKGNTDALDDDPMPIPPGELTE